MTSTERRTSPRQTTRLLVALRCMDDGQVTWSGFASTVNLSADGVLLELPDRMVVGQQVALELLLDENEVVQVAGTVKRVRPVLVGYHIAVAFEKLDAASLRLLAKQTRYEL